MFGFLCFKQTSPVNYQNSSLSALFPLQYYSNNPATWSVTYENLIIRYWFHCDMSQQGIILLNIKKKHFSFIAQQLISCVKPKCPHCVWEWIKEKVCVYILCLSKPVRLLRVCVCVSCFLPCCWTCRMCVDARGGTICCLDSGASHQYGKPVGWTTPTPSCVSLRLSSCEHHQPAGVEITQIHSAHACVHTIINNSPYRLPLARHHTVRLDTDR